MLRRNGAVAALWLALAATAISQDASAFGGIGRRAEGAASADALVAIQQAFRRRIPSSSSPNKLVEGADALGQLVARARDLDAPLALFDALASDADQLIDRVRSVRDALEDRAGDDEAKLEALYRSKDWQRLDYCQVTLGYWRGWVALGRARHLEAGDPREDALELAVASFSRSAFELRLPKVATASLLGLGTAQRQLGDEKAAERTLGTLLKQLQLTPDAQLDAAARYELASIALARGDVARASTLIAAIPKGRLSRADRLDLTRREAVGLLKSGSDLDRAATLLRQMLDAGEPYSAQAAAIAEQNQKLLEGRDLGALGRLLTAERAFTAGDYPAARAAYADALKNPQAIPGLNRSNVEYKYAFALAETGALGQAAKILDRLTADRDAGDARGLAAPLFYSVAERIAAADAGQAAQAQALRAAERLIQIAPNASGSDAARYRAARGREARGSTKSSIAQLEAIPENSAAYPAARLDLVRLRGEELQNLEQRGRTRGLRELAPVLARDIARVRSLIASGAIEKDPDRDATIAVWAAKTAYWSGAEAAEVDARIAEARSSKPSVESERTLLRLELRNRVRARQWRQLDAMFAKRSDAALRRDFPIWHESLNAAKRGGAPKPQIVSWYERLALLSPKRSRETLALGHAEALLAAGQAEDAAAQAEGLIQGDRYWADAWIVYAKALDRSGDDEGALQAWRRISDGTDSGTGPWVEAKLRAAEAARRLDDPGSACRAIDGLSDAELSAKAKGRLAAASAGCGTD
jgi:thioredoxin-like negative regulator of GroEL